MFWLVLIIVLIIWLIAAFEFWEIARMKGHEKTRYFWYSFLFGLVGWMMVIALPDRAESSNAASGQSDDGGGSVSDELPDL